MSNYDVVVIGAGVIGTSVAYHIQKKGMRVCLIENGDIASGTSSHCDAVALICDKDPGIDTKQGYASLLRFKELKDELEYDFEFVQRGCLYVCETDIEMEAAKSYVDVQVADGYDMRMLDREEIYEKEPLLAKDLIGGFWSEPDAGVNPYKLCFSFVNELKKMGAAVMVNTEVLDIGLVDGKVDKVITDRGEIKTEKVINCAGVWAPFIGKMVGLNIPIQPRKGLIMISERGNPVVHQKVQ